MAAWIAGVDGAKAGWLWVTAWLDGTAIDAGLAPKWRDLAHKGAEMVAVDMPIGLAESGPRTCDIAARKLLPPNRKASVFPPPRRPMLACSTWAEANARGRALDGRGISRQAWNLTAKIGELDAALAPADQACIREVHPELVFLRLNHGAPLPRKRTREGRDLRFRLLTRAGFAEIGQHLERFPRRHATPDDVLDAAACALAARDMLLGSATCLPSKPPTDARGLRMEIWY